MRVGSVFGVTVILNRWWLILMLVLAICGWLPSMVVLLGALLIHEWAHVLMARACGVAVSEVELLPFGGVARLDDARTMTASDEVKIALAGPMINLIIAMALAFYDYWYPLSRLPVSFMISCNMSLCAMNLLPAFPLDGGRILRALLARKHGMARATRIAAMSGCVCGAVLFIGGVWGMAYGVVSLTIPATSVFLFLAALREIRHAPYMIARDAMHKRINLHRGRSVGIRWVAVNENTLLHNVNAQRYTQQYRMVAVLGDDMRVRGILSETELMDAQLRAEADVTVGSLLQGRRQETILSGIPGAANRYAASV